jgi:hypothetical protein
VQLYIEEGVSGVISRAMDAACRESFGKEPDPNGGAGAHVDSPCPIADERRRLVPRWFQPLSLSSENLVSKAFAFKLNLRRYTTACS